MSNHKAAKVKEVPTDAHLDCLLKTSVCLFARSQIRLNGGCNNVSLMLGDTVVGRS